MNIVVLAFSLGSDVCLYNDLLIVSWVYMQQFTVSTQSTKHMSLSKLYFLMVIFATQCALWFYIL